MKKHTKEYAEKMAKKYVSDMHITDDHKAKVDYYLGYLKAIEVNAVPELIEASVELLKELRYAMHNVGALSISDYERGEIINANSTILKAEQTLKKVTE